MQIPRLREWRVARALTQVELAEKAGLSERSVAGYEAGGGAHLPTIRKLARALNVEVTDLMGEADLPKASAPLSGQGKPAPVTVELPPLEAKAELQPITVDRGYLVSVLRERAGMSADEAEATVRRLEVA